MKIDTETKQFAFDDNGEMSRPMGVNMVLVESDLNNDEIDQLMHLEVNESLNLGGGLSLVRIS